jgi:predicted transcriptional regulator
MGRTHVRLDDALLDAIDSVAGKRGRSRFLEEAAREKLARLELESALNATAGIAQDKDYPDWSTRQRAAEWVRRTRATEQPS